MELAITVPVDTLDKVTAQPDSILYRDIKSWWRLQSSWECDASISVTGMYFESARGRAKRATALWMLCD